MSPALATSPHVTIADELRALVVATPARSRLATSPGLATLQMSRLLTRCALRRDGQRPLVFRGVELLRFGSGQPSGPHTILRIFTTDQDEFLAYLSVSPPEGAGARDTHRVNCIETADDVLSMLRVCDAESLILEPDPLQRAGNVKTIAFQKLAAELNDLCTQVQRHLNY